MKRALFLAVVMAAARYARADLAGDVQAWTNGIYLAFIGDSITAGYPNYRPATDGGPSGDTNANLASQVLTISGGVVTATNRGVSGRQWYQLPADATNALVHRPKYLFVRCGVNDIAVLNPWSQVLGALNTIRSACAQSNTLLIVQDILPWTGGTDANNLTVRSWNSNFTSWASTSGVRRIADHDLFGTNRASTGFADDLLPSFDSDGVHLRTNAYPFWARIVISNLVEWASRPLLVLTEPTARGLTGHIFDRWVAQIAREGNFSPVVVRELPRWTGNWVTNDWPGLNRMSNEVVRVQPAAVQIFGRLPRLKTGGHALDGHELRCVITDGWLGSTNFTFTDSVNWGMPGTVEGVSSAIGSNVAGDGIPDETSAPFGRPVARLDASGMAAASGNFASGYWAGVQVLQAIDEGEWLRRYLTNNLAYRQRFWVPSETGIINNSGSCFANYAAITATNTTVSWTLSTDVTAAAGVTNRWVYTDSQASLYSPNFVTSGGSVMETVALVVYKSYQMEVASGAAYMQRALFPGFHTRPLALWVAWSVGNFGTTCFWVSRPADVTFADSIRSSCIQYGDGNTYYWQFPAAGDLTLPMDAVTQLPPATATVGTLNVTHLP